MGIAHNLKHCLNYHHWHSLYSLQDEDCCDDDR
jgi:hypothetical protein